MNRTSCNRTRFLFLASDPVLSPYARPNGCPDRSHLLHERRSRNAVVDRVDTILKLHAQRADATTDAERNRLQQRIDEVDAEIDKLVYELYGLGEEEIRIVEGSVTS